MFRRRPATGVTQRLGGSPVAQPRSTHVVTADQLAQAEPALRRFVAVILWLFSTAGNVIAFAGGWHDIHMNRAFVIALGLSLLWQGTCTLVQFITCRYWWSPLYLIALGASLVPAYIGYRPLIAAPLTAWAAGIESDVFGSLATLTAAAPETILWALAIHAIYAVGLVYVDIIPERVFVKH